MVAQTTMLFLWRFGDVPGEPVARWGRGRSVRAEPRRPTPFRVPRAARGTRDP